MTHDEQSLLEILGRHAHRKPDMLGPDETLLDLGIDSLKFIVVILEIEERLQRKVFNIENIGKLRTVGDMLALLDMRVHQNHAVKHP